MTDVQEAMKRMQAKMALDKSMLTSQMACTAGRVGDDLIAAIQQCIEGYRQLLDTTPPDDMLVRPDDLEKQIADATEWLARTYETAERFDEASASYEEAGRLYERRGDQTGVQRCLDKAGELQIYVDGDLDAELQRLQQRLVSAEPGTLDHVQVLIMIGELFAQAHDDFEAEKYLKEAEAELEAVGGLPSDGALLSDLAGSIHGIMSPSGTQGPTPVEVGLQQRLLSHRLYLALAGIYRKTRPELAAKYEAEVKQTVSGDLSKTLGELIDCGGDVSEFLRRRE